VETARDGGEREREREREGAEGAEYWRRRSSRKHNLKAVDHPAPPRTFLNTRGRAPRTDNSARYLETARPIDLRPSDRQGGKRVGTADGGGYIDCQGLRIRVSRERHLLPLSLLPLLPQHSPKEERERERERENPRDSLQRFRPRGATVRDRVGIYRVTRGGFLAARASKGASSHPPSRPFCSVRPSCVGSYVLVSCRPAFFGNRTDKSVLNVVRG